MAVAMNKRTRTTNCRADQWIRKALSLAQLAVPRTRQMLLLLLVHRGSSGQRHLVGQAALANWSLDQSHRVACSFNLER